MTREQQQAYDKAREEILAAVARTRAGEPVTEMHLTDRGLTAVPPEIGQLTALTALDLVRNQLTALPPEIGRLTALTQLTLGGNQLTALPPEIGQLTALTLLYLPRNELTALPPEIGQLTVLTKLSLVHNQLTALPPEIGRLTALTELYLFNNQLTALPPEIGRLKKLTRLFLHDNPALKLPSEILGPKYDEVRLKKRPAAPQFILGYYFRLNPVKVKAAPKPLLEARIIVVGDGAAGKTSLVRQLLHGQEARPEEESTRDVAIETWQVKLRGKTVQANIWDFGGQKQMHAAHPYFFTARTLYLIVAEARKDQQDRAAYWLKMVEKYGEGARALVVVNKADGHPVSLDRPKLLDAFRDNLPEDASRAFFPVSCKTGAGVAELRAALREELENMEQVWVEWPEEWWKVKEGLRAMRQPQGKKSARKSLDRLANLQPSVRRARPGGAETLEYSEWRSLCDECGVTTEKDRDWLLEMLGHIGHVVCFPRNARLQQLGVLNPDWVTRGIYPLLADRGLADRGGLLRLEDLCAILPGDRYPREHHVWLIELMKAFELIFEDASRQLLLPVHLPADSPEWAQPDAWAGAEVLHLELRYDGVLPESVISQFIVRKHTEARQPGEWWRHGIALRRDGCEALVRAHVEEQNPRIEIRLRGPRAPRRELLSAIRETLRDPADSRPPVLHVVLGPGCAEPYADLLLYAADGERTRKFIIGGRSETRVLADILDLIEAPAQQSATREAINLHFNPSIAVNPNIEVNPHMNQDRHDINIHGNITNSQVGQTLTNCTNNVNQQPDGPMKDALAELVQAVQQLINKLPADKKEKQEDLAKDLEMVVEQATAAKPHRKWYEVSAAGLNEAAEWVGGFAGSIGKALGKVTGLLPGA